MEMIDTSIDSINQLILKLQQDEMRIDESIDASIKEQIKGTPKTNSEIEIIRVKISTKYHSQIQNKLVELENARNNLLVIKEKYKELISNES
jgi:hypothetical protein